MAKILIVDDDVDITKMLVRRLKKAGHEVHTAENGKVGVETALSIAPALTLMDMHMPVMDGYEASRTLRAKGFTGIIVALTASAMASDKNKSIEAGCDYFIPKPFGSDFEGALSAILEKRRADS
ncbi:MAG: response regulator [Candidatus Magnetominusculus sp. LBB02]|nr:response regulator [Candidatus Magnetominusculus sp. LBB02]